MAEESLFDVNPMLPEEDLFAPESGGHTPEITPESEAYGRGFLLSLLGPEPDILPNLEATASANLMTQESEEERQIIDALMQDNLAIANAAGTEVLMDNPSLETLESLEEYYRGVAEDNFSLVEETGKVLTDKVDLDASVRFGREQTEAWFNQRKLISDEQAAFDSFLEDDHLYGKTKGYLSFVAKMILPGAETIGLRKIFKELDPEGAKKYYDPADTAKIVDPLDIGYTGTVNTIMLGDALDALTQGIIDAKPTDQNEMLTRLYKIVKESPNALPYKILFDWASRDGVNKKHQMGELLYEIGKGNVEGIDWSKHFANLRGLLGALPIGVPRLSKMAGTAKAARDGVVSNLPEVRLNTVWIHEQPGPSITGPAAPKLLTHIGGDTPTASVPNPYVFNGRNVDSTLDTIDATDPLMAARLFTTLDRQVVETYGLRAEDVLSRFIPPPTGFKTSGMSEAALSKLKGHGEALEARMADIKPSIHYTDLEKAEVLATIKARLASKVGMKLFTGKSTVEHSDTGFVVNSVYGKDELGGFGTLSEVKAGLTHIGENFENVEVIAINPITQEFSNVTVAALKDSREISGDFYISVKAPHEYTPEDVLNFTTGNIGGRAFTPKAGAWFVPNQFTFDNFLVRSANRAVDMIPTIQKHLNPYVKPFLKSNRATKIKVSDALKLGNKEQRVLTKNEFNGSQADYDIYTTTRAFFDKVHDIRDAGVRKHLVAQNMRWVTNESSGFNGVGKAVDTLPVGIKHVWDVEAKTYKVIDDAFLKKNKQKGGKFVELWKPHKNKGGQYHYAIIGPNTKVTELPSSVLQYHKGYIPTMYKEPYFIHTEVPTTVNGNRLGWDGNPIMDRVTLGTVEGKAAGDRILAAFRADPRNEGITISAERDLAKVVNPIPDPSTTSMFWEKRGDPLANLESGELSVVETPIGAIHSTVKSLASTVSMSDYIGGMTGRYMGSYGKQVTIPGEFSSPNTKLLANTEHGRTAKAMYDEINWLRSIAIDQDTYYKSTINGLAHFLNTTGFEKTSNLIDANLYNLSPTSTLRGTTFMLFVGSQIGRQLIQNAGTILFTGLENPALAALGVADSVGIIGAMVTKGLQGPNSTAYKGMLTVLSKTMGVTPNQADKIVESFKRSNLFPTVDAHTMFNSGFLESKDEIENLLTTFALGAPRGIGFVLKGAKTIGFDTGEKANLLMNWAFSRRTFAEMNNLKLGDPKLFTAEVEAEIANMTRVRTGNQNKAGTSTATRVAPLPMNLLGFTVTMTLKSLYNDVVAQGLKGFNKVDARLKFVVVGTFLYGTSMWATALEDFEVRTGYIIPEPVKDLMVASALDWSINSTLEAITGEESDLYASKSLNPASLYGIMSQAIDFMGEAAVLGWTGAAGSAVGDLVDATRLAKATTLYTDLPTPDKIQFILEQAPKVLKGYSDASKAYWAAQSGYFLTRDGETTTKATLPHLLGKVLGIGTLAEESLYSKRRMNKRLKEQETAFVKDTVDMFIRLTQSGLSDNVYAEIENFTKNYFPGWDPVELQRLSVRVAEKYSNYLKGTSATDKDLLKNRSRTAANRKTLEATLRDKRAPESLKKQIKEILDSYYGED